MLPDSRVVARRVELLAKEGGRYTFTRLLHKEYTPDVIEHLVRYHFGTLESNREKDDDLQAIYCDLMQAIKALQGDARKAVTLMIQGYDMRDPETGIAPALGLPVDVTTKIIKQAYVEMSAFLKGAA